VLKISNVYYKIRVPSTDQISSSSEYYAGGHEHNVTENQKTALIAAGLGITASNFE